LNCGAMLRECIRYEALTKILLNSDNFYDFFKYVEVSTFDIASDAFATFKVRPPTAGERDSLTAGRGKANGR
jgi:Mo25-like